MWFHFQAPRKHAFCNSQLRHWQWNQDLWHCGNLEPNLSYCSPHPLFSLVHTRSYQGAYHAFIWRVDHSTFTPHGSGHNALGSFKGRPVQVLVLAVSAVVLWVCEGLDTNFRSPAPQNIYSTCLWTVDQLHPRKQPSPLSSSGLSPNLFLQSLSPILGNTVFLLLLLLFVLFYCCFSPFLWELSLSPRVPFSAIFPSSWLFSMIAQ